MDWNICFTFHLCEIQNMTLPPITLSRQFIGDFSEADAPCCALGLVRTADTVTGFFAMKPERSVPRHVLDLGIGFGHRILPTVDEHPVCQFAFNFYGFEQYSVLVNPSNTLALKAIETMVEQRDYFFFILNPDDRVSAFRSDLGEENLVGLRDSLPLMRNTQTPQALYENGVRAFRQAPNPPDMKILDWVCRDDPKYLDLENDTVDLSSIG